LDFCHTTGSRSLELERTRGQISVTVKVASRNKRHVRYTVCPKKVESILTGLSSPVVLAKNIYTRRTRARITFMAGHLPSRLLSS